MNDYADRTDELSYIKKAIDDDVASVFLMAGKAYGLTSFLNDKLALDLKSKDIYTFYIDANNSNSLAAGLLNCIIKDLELYQILQQCFDNSYGERDASVYQNIAKGVPYLGEFLSHLMGKRSAVPIYTGNFLSATEEILSVFFTNIIQKSVIIIDNAQSMLEDSYNTICDLIKYNNIHFIFAITEYTDNYIKLKNFLNIKQFSIREVIFCAPHASLIIELGKLFNHDIKRKEAERAIIMTNGNIHKIVEMISHPHAEYHLNTWGKAIVSILNICTFPVSENELYSIVKKCHLYSPNPQESFKKTIAELLTLSIISKQENYYELRSLNHPDVNSFINSYLDQIVYKKIVLSYFKEQNEYDKRISRFLYELSHELKDSSCDFFARLIIKHALQEGSKIDYDVIDAANIDESSQNDCILCSIIYAQKREYNEALKWFEKVNVNENFYLKSFYGILLNRVRNHGKAEKILIDSLDKIDDLEVKTIVYSFLISNYVHQENLKEAQATYNIALAECKNTQSFGYLVRNAVSAFNERRIDMYDDALSSFLNSNDMFGYYTTLSNRGYAILSQNIVEGKENLLIACENLSLYGENITHIVNNDLGIAYLLENDYENAKYYFDKVIANEHSGMPKIFATINLACCDAIAGNHKKALHDIKGLQKEVEESPLDRIRQKYYINRLFIEYICGLPIDEYIFKCANKHKDRYNPNKTASTLAFYTKNSKVKNTKTINNWSKLYSACGLSYWFLNPLKIFPKCILDEIIPI